MLSRHIQDMSSRCVQDMSSTTFRFPRRLEEVLKTSRNMSWKMENCYAEDVFKTSWRQAKCLPGISITNKSKSVSNESISHKSTSHECKANPRCIN